MLGSSRFNLLVVALIAFVSFVTARTVITSTSCATRYGYYVPQNKIPKITKTIRKTAPYTITRWKTATKPRSTRTVKVTKTVTSQRYATIWQTSTTTSLVTIWIGTTTLTRTVHDTTTITTATVTLSESTFTITTPSVTVAAPSGFVAIDDDPANEGARYPPPEDPWWWGVRRSAEPEPEPKPVPEPEPKPVAYGYGKYVTAVTCTKTLLTKTGTSDLWRTTTKAAATTTKTLIVSTKTVLLPLLTTTKTTTKIIPITTSKYKVQFVTGIFFTKTLTSYTDTTTYLSTVSSSLPVPTYYESCGPKNKSPLLELDRQWAAYEAGPYPDEKVVVLWNNGTSYDCCAACHNYDQGGVCIGSVWRAQTWWGEQKCLGPPQTSEICPEFTAKCELIIATSDAPAQCRQHTYNFIKTVNVKETILSNGLSCKRFKFVWFMDQF